MAVPPPDNNNPSSRFSFDERPPAQPVYGMSASPQSQQDTAPRRRYEDDESAGDMLLEEVDDVLGITDRLIGCSWWLFTLPFRIVIRIIGAIFD